MLDIYLGESLISLIGLFNEPLKNSAKLMAAELELIK